MSRDLLGGLTKEEREKLNISIANRPPRKSLTDNNIIRNYSGDPALGERAAKLQRSLLEDDLNQKLYSRKDLEYLVNRGIIQEHSVAPSLHESSRKLEKEFRKNSLNALIYARPDKSQLYAKGILRPGNRSSVVERHIKELEYQVNQNKLSHFLQKRPTIQEITQSGYYHPLPSTMHEDQRSFLEKNLQSRPARRSLTEKGILTEYDHPDRRIAPILEARAKQLQKEFSKISLNQKLYNRPTEEFLMQRNVLQGSHIAPSLHQSRKELEHKMMKDRLNAKLWQRKGRDELIRQGVLPHGTSSNPIQDKRKQLEYNMRSDMLSRNLAKRPSLQDVVEKGYYQPDNASQPLDQSEIKHNNDFVKKLDQQDYLQRRSKNFHLTRILLKFVASMAQAGKITLEQKGQLKDLIVDQDKTILAVAETFDDRNDLNDFEDSIVRLALRNA